MLEYDCLRLAGLTCQILLVCNGLLAGELNTDMGSFIAFSWWINLLKAAPVQADYTFFTGNVQPSLMAGGYTTIAPAADGAPSPSTPSVARAPTPPMSSSG